MNAGRRIDVRGVVQGVGFRPWVYRLALEEGLTGRVFNDAEGVRIEAFGSSRALDVFVARLAEATPPASEIRSLRTRDLPPEASAAFEIAPSREDGVRRFSIPPDLPTCPDCLVELFDPDDRRFRYPFLNCTSCGPRFTIARGVPYDRAATTMAPFAMCGACRREYETPGDRRFHAQPNACPACGPTLRAVDDRGHDVVCGRDAVDAAVRALRDGFVVAVKGLGGFHLAADARSDAAVARLRERKRRDAKPLAVMPRDPAAAEVLAALSEEERRLLVSPERPIVLAARRAGAPVADAVAPRSPLVGLLLPYTPLHHLLLEGVASPLVMTSGNLSDEPIAAGNGEALARLRGVADLFLVHDREIESPCDDSVARVVAGRPVVLRRARGYVPRAIPLVRPVARPVLGCGADLKSTFCLAFGDSAYLSPHLGDLEGDAAFTRYRETVARFERLLGVSPEVVAHDLHPGFASTAFARTFADVDTVAVAHHHAHVASAMAEHGLAGEVFGLAWDGTGLGTDDASWGGELLLASAAGFERLATFRPVALAGGDAAVREPWRVALALLLDAFDGEAPLDRLPLFADRPREATVIREMLEKGVHAPPAHGVGRLFDGIGALVLGRARSRFEGDVALDWNLAADPRETRGYPIGIDAPAAGLWSVDTRPLVRAVTADLLAGRSSATISARFHVALAEAAAALVREAIRVRGPRPVVLTGGCFQNARLAEDVAARLLGEADVRLHERVPPGDGGVSLGQVFVADAVLHRKGGV